MILAENNVGQLIRMAPSCPLVGMSSLRYSFNTGLEEVLARTGRLYTIGCNIVFSCLGRTREGPRLLSFVLGVNLKGGSLKYGVDLVTNHCNIRLLLPPNLPEHLSPSYVHLEGHYPES